MSSVPVAVNHLVVQFIGQRERKVLPKDRFEICLPHRGDIFQRQFKPRRDPFRRRGHHGDRPDRPDRRGGLRQRRRVLPLRDRAGRIGAGRHARHGDSQSRRDRVGEHHRPNRIEIHTDRSRCRRDRAALGVPLFGRHVPKLQGNSGHPGGGGKLGLGPVDHPAPRRREQIVRERRLAAKLDPLAHLSVGRIGFRGLLLPFLGLARDH